MATHISKDDTDEQSPLISKNASALASAKGIQHEILQAIWTFLSPSKDVVTNDNLNVFFLLVNTMIGSGILNQPEVFAEAGIFPATILYILSAFGIWSGVVLLVEAGVVSSTNDYNSVAEIALGPSGGQIVDFAIFMDGFGGLLSYIETVGGLLSYLLIQWTGVDSWATGTIFVTAVITLALAFPACLVRHYGLLTWASKISVFSISCLAVLIVVFGPIYGSASASEPIEYWASDYGSMDAMGSIIFSFTYAQATFHAYNTLRPKSIENWRNVTFSATIVGAGISYVIGLVGYLSFRDQTDADVLYDFDFDISVFATLVKVLVVVHLILYIPIDIVIIRHSLLRTFNYDALLLDVVPYTMVTFALLLAATIIIVILLYYGVSDGTAFDYTLDLTGGLASSVVSFVLPGLIALRIFPYKSIANTWGTMLCAFGAMVFVIVPVYLVIDSLYA